MSDATCPTPQLLADYVLGKTPEATAAGIAAHVEGCAACQSRLDTLDALSDTVIACLRFVPGVAAVDETLLREVIARVESITAEFGWPPGDPFAEAVLPVRVGHYRLVEKLGQGGMGCVFRAEDEALKKQVAVKVPCRRRFESAEELDRVLAEARAAARLTHAGIVPVLYFGREPDGTCYIVMEYVEGQLLAQRLLSGPLPPRRPRCCWRPWPRRLPRSTSRASSIAT